MLIISVIVYLTFITFMFNYICEYFCLVIIYS